MGVIVGVAMGTVFLADFAWVGGGWAQRSMEIRGWEMGECTGISEWRGCGWVPEFRATGPRPWARQTSDSITREETPLVHKETQHKAEKREGGREVHISGFRPS